MLVYKHTETIEYIKKVDYFLREIQTSWVITGKFLGLKNVKFPWYCFYMELSI